MGVISPLSHSSGLVAAALRQGLAPSFCVLSFLLVVITVGVPEVGAKSDSSAQLSLRWPLCLRAAIVIIVVVVVIIIK